MQKILGEEMRGYYSEGHFLLSSAQKRSLTGQLFFADSYIHIFYIFIHRKNYL